MNDCCACVAGIRLPAWAGGGLTLYEPAECADGWTPSTQPQSYFDADGNFGCPNYFCEKRIGWTMSTDVQAVSAPESGSTCWATLPALVPHPNTLSDTDGGAASSQGASYFTERFCPGWAKFVSSNSCLDSDPGCDASGSAIFDGGQDMVNIFLFRFYFDFLIAFLIKTPENTHCCVHSMISAISCPAASWNLADMLALCLR